MIGSAMADTQSTASDKVILWLGEDGQKEPMVLHTSRTTLLKVKLFRKNHLLLRRCFLAKPGRAVNVLIWHIWICLLEGLMPTLVQALLRNCVGALLQQLFSSPPV